MAAAPPIHFDVRYGDSCMRGTAAADSTVNVTWRDSAGNLKASGSVPTSFGRWELCGDTGVYAAIGDHLRAADGTSTRKYKLPNFSIGADRVNDVFYGTGPAHRTLTIVYGAGRLADFDYTHHFRPGDDGTWTFDPNDLEDVDGGQYVSLYWRSPNSDTLAADATPPSVTPVLGTPRFRGGTTAPNHARLLPPGRSTNTKLAGGLLPVR